jgi:hypothetical protein
MLLEDVLDISSVASMYSDLYTSPSQESPIFNTAASSRDLAITKHPYCLATAESKPGMSSCLQKRTYCMCAKQYLRYLTCRPMTTDTLNMPPIPWQSAFEASSRKVSRVRSDIFCRIQHVILSAAYSGAAFDERIDPACNPY